MRHTRAGVRSTPRRIDGGSVSEAVRSNLITRGEAGQSRAAAELCNKGGGVLHRETHLLFPRIGEEEELDGPPQGGATLLLPPPRGQRPPIHADIILC